MQFALITQINQINEQPEVTQRPSASTTVSFTSKLPSTRSSVGLSSVSIYPNGHDTTSSMPETTKDSFENEIGLDDIDFKLPTTKFSTRVTSSVSSTKSLPVTSTTLKPFVTTKNLPTKLPETSIFTTSQPKISSTISSTTSFIRTTTESFLDKNFKALQDLLAKPNRVTPYSRDTTTSFETTTEIPVTTTRNFIDKNFQALQELLAKQTKPSPFTKSTKIQTTTEIPSTTQNYIDKNSQILQELLAKNRATPFSRATTVTQFRSTEVPSTTEFEELILSTLRPSSTTSKPSSPIQKIKRPSAQTRLTTVSFKTSSTTPKPFIQTTTEKVTTVPPKTSTIPPKTSTVSIPKLPSSTVSILKSPPSTHRFVTSTTEPTTVLSSTPETISSTHRFMPINIPDDYLTTRISSTTKKRAPYSDAEDVEFLVSLK